MRINKKAAAVAVAAVTLAGVGTAYAYWTTSGSGGGSATTAAGDALSLTVQQLVQPAPTALHPGAAESALSGTVTNPTLNDSDYAVRSLTIKWTVAPLTGKTCDATNYTVNGVVGLPAVANDPTTPDVDESAPSQGSTSVFLSRSGVTTTAVSNPIELAPTQTATWSALSGFKDKAATNQDGCKGAQINYAYTVNP